MRALRRFVIRLSRSVMRWQDEERLREEIETHLALQTAENVRAGLSPDEARRQARLKLGAVESVKEDYREEQGLSFLNRLGQDVWYTLRQLRQAPSFAIAAIATLALGIGATTPIVTIANGVLVRPLPFAHPEDLVQLNETQPPTSSSTGFDGPVVYRDFDQWRAHSALLERVLTFVHSRRNLQNHGEAEPVITVGAERGLFAMLGVAPLLGRTFDDQDPLTVAVASYGFWKERLNGDSSAVGHRLTIDGQTFTLIGVMPEGFQFPYRRSATGLFDGFASTALWIPWRSQRAHGSIATRGWTPWWRG